jgi:hypothetical protein
MSEEYEQRYKNAVSAAGEGNGSYFLLQYVLESIEVWVRGGVGGDT